MKYSTNHSREFINWIVPFLMGLMQAINTFSLAFYCIVKMCEQTSVLDTMTAFVSFNQVIFVPNYLALAMADETALSKSAPGLKHSCYRRDKEKVRTLPVRLGRLIYSTFRLIYGAFIYYFMPLYALLLPYRNLVEKYV